MPYERKIINDPVFGFINIPKGLLYDIVRHPLLQRLTRIKQVGLSSVVYPGAQHTRFQHSLGAFYLMSEAITQLASKGNFIFDSEAEAVQAAILPPRIRKKITDFRRAVPLPFLKKRELAKTNQKNPKEVLYVS